MHRIPNALACGGAISVTCPVHPRVKLYEGRHGTTNQELSGAVCVAELMYCSKARPAFLFRPHTHLLVWIAYDAQVHCEADQLLPFRKGLVFTLQGRGDISSRSNFGRRRSEILPSKKADGLMIPAQLRGLSAFDQPSGLTSRLAYDFLR